MSPNALIVRNVTEAVPELLRLLVSRGRSRDDRLVVEEEVTVLYLYPYDRVVAWPQWPDSPLRVFGEAVRNASNMSFDEMLRNADVQMNGSLVFYVTFDESSLVDFVGAITATTSIAMECCQAWRGTPVENLQLTVSQLWCEKSLVDRVGELLLEVEPYPVTEERVRIDQDAARELRAFVGNGPNVMGYRSRFIRRVAVPMFRAEMLSTEGQRVAASELLAASQQTDWVAAARRWLEEQS